MRLKIYTKTKGKTMKLFITLQGKGGVGKSTASLILAQYFTQKGESLVCVDTDGVNLTFARYKSLSVLDSNTLSDDGERADLTKIDSLFNNLLSNQEYADKTVIIDNGATSFIPIRKYLLDSGIHTMGLDITIVIPLMAGESKDSTMIGANDTLDNFGDNVKYLIIENQRDGAINFQSTKLHKKFQEREGYFGTITVPSIDSKSLLGADFNIMLQNGLLYADLNASDKLQILSKSRLKQYYTKIFQQLESLGV